MNLIKLENDIYCTYQRQGNDKNGNPIYIINFFDKNCHNINYKVDYRKDKYNNIKTTSYNIDDTINYMLSKIK